MGQTIEQGFTKENIPKGNTFLNYLLGNCKFKK